MLQLESGEHSNSSALSSVSQLPESDLVTTNEIDEFLNHGNISADLMTSAASQSEAAKRKLHQVDTSAGIPGGSGHSSSSSNNLPDGPSYSQDAVDDYPKLEKVVSFDSLAGHIRPNASRPPLSTPNGSSSKSNVGAFGITGSPPLAAGVASGTVGGGMLSRQHSLELPPPGGYNYTYTAPHATKKQKTGAGMGEGVLGSGEAEATRGRMMEGQSLSRIPPLSRQDTEEVSKADQTCMHASTTSSLLPSLHCRIDSSPC
jgi:hypothetical protein